MKRRKIRWYVSNDEDSWWSNGEWHQAAHMDDLGSFTNMASPKTKQGAYRVARACPAKNVLVLSRNTRGLFTRWRIENGELTKYQGKR